MVAALPPVCTCLCACKLTTGLVGLHPSSSFRTHLTPPARCPLFVPGSAEARVADQSRSLPHCVCAAPRLAGALGPLVTAPLFHRGLATGIEAAIGAGSRSKVKYNDERNQQLSPDASHLR